MISRSAQSWTPGETVRVGFMRLIVKAAIPTPSDYAPDAYLLTNTAGDRLYKFVPHNGVRHIHIEEARELLEQVEHYAVHNAEQAAARAAEQSRRGAAIGALFARVTA